MHFLCYDAKNLVIINMSVQDKQYIAAVDIGSRNCKLIIASIMNNNLQIEDSLSKFVGLGDSAVRLQKFSDDVMNDALHTIDLFTRKIKKYKNIDFKIVATEAARMAKNSNTLKQKAKQLYGVDINIIPSDEEAIYAAFGCTEIIKTDTEYAIIFDIGGCSTELVLVEKSNNNIKVLDSISMHLGIISSAKNIKASPFKLYKKISEDITEVVKKFNEKNNIHTILTNKICQLISTSGTSTTLAGIHMNMRLYDRDKINGSEINFIEAQKAIQFIQMMTKEQRAFHPCIGKNKAEYIIGGLAIFEGIYNCYKNMSISVTDTGVCAGILKKLAQKYE